MPIIYSIIFGIIFLFTLAFIIIFKSYGKDNSHPKGNSPILNFVEGSSLFVLHTACKLLHKRKSNDYLRCVSFSLIVTLFISLTGLIYTVSSFFSPDESVLSISRPDAGQGDTTISLIADSELYSGNIDVEVKNKKYTFEESMEIFYKYRKELDSCLLGSNKSFLMVTSPLTLPSSIGDENISVSWYISNPDIIDYSGKLINENISPDGSELEIVATLTLGENTAEICYTIVAYPSPLSSKDKLISGISEYINSSDEIYKDSITLPTEIDGIAVSFYKDKSELPSMDISFGTNYISNIDCGT